MTSTYTLAASASPGSLIACNPAADLKMTAARIDCALTAIDGPARP